ncbi:C-type lectin domain family 2 member E-like isoform X3 [Agelaius tricolor]|uniref:C-type lectin domain family 2 member E-like isoform X3 n=1 Tax=Agelaius tricolor TaxID=9191 RepID=UPI0039F20666
MELLEQRAEGRSNFSHRCTNNRKAIIAVTVLTVVLPLTVTIIMLAAKKDPPCPATALPSCLESGIGFGNKCFYFLEEEVDWEGSQHSCLSRQAHLATIDTREELVPVSRYSKCPTAAPSGTSSCWQTRGSCSSCTSASYWASPWLPSWATASSSAP